MGLSLLPAVWRPPFPARTSLSFAWRVSSARSEIQTEWNRLLPARQRPLALLVSPFSYRFMVVRMLRHATVLRNTFELPAEPVGLVRLRLPIPPTPRGSPEVWCMGTRPQRPNIPCTGYQACSPESMRETATPERYARLPSHPIPPGVANPVSPGSHPPLRRMTGPPQPDLEATPKADWCLR